MNTKFQLISHSRMIAAHLKLESPKFNQSVVLESQTCLHKNELATTFHSLVMMDIGIQIYRKKNYA